jgi:hypothetical protein
MQSRGVDEENAPRFAFRAQQFFELPLQTINEIYSLGVKQEDILDQVSKKEHLERYFKRINYYYRKLSE